MNMMKVKDITTLNNFEYHNEFVLAFKQYKVGNGIRIEKANIKVYDSFPTLDVLKSNTTEEFHRVPKSSDTSIPEPQVLQQSVIEQQNEEDSNTSSYMFTCPEPNCLLSFMKYGNLSKHLDKGDHQLRQSHKSLSDKAKEEYIRQLDTKKSSLVNTSSESTSSGSTLQSGWALKSKRVVKRFTTDQSNFLKEMFQKGEMTGHKCDPEEVSVSMRTVKMDGKRRFSQNDFLTATQISSFFSRLSFDKKKVSKKYPKRWCGSVLEPLRTLYKQNKINFL